MFAVAATLLGVATPAIIGASGAAASAATLPADTSGFKGFNWARQDDNFTPGPLVLLGLNLTDSYATVQTKANAMLTAFASKGANTVRLPVNPATTNTNTAVGPDWWDSYRAVIDTATARGFKVDLSYWNEKTPGNQISNISTWNTMWDIITAKYESNPLVYFDPMNEPVGYTTAQWETIAAKWLTDRPTVPRNQVILAGGGWDWDTLSLCHDSRFDGTLLAFHHYYWDEDITTYSGWVSKFKSYIGDCAARTILEEFGADQDTHLNFTDPNSTDKEVVFLRALTDSVRDLHVGSIVGAHVIRFWR